MELLSRLKKNEILYNFFPFDVSQLIERGLYMNNTAFLIFKIIIWTVWIIIVSLQLMYWKLKILLYFSSWCLLLGVTHSTTSVLELIFSQKLKPYKIWRFNHFLFAIETVMSMLIAVFDSILITRSYLEYTKSESGANFMYYSTAVVPAILNWIELVFNSTIISNYKCLTIFLIVGVPYILLLIVYTLTVQPIYKEISFRDANSFLVLLASFVISGIAYLLIRIYCEVFKLGKAISLLSEFQSQTHSIEDQTNTKSQLDDYKKPKNLADYTKIAAQRKPAPVRGPRVKKMLPSLRKVFTSIISEEGF